MSDAIELAPGIGQRTEAFEFNLVEAASGRPLGQVHPLRAPDATPTLDQAAGAVITRTLTLDFDVADAARIDAASMRLEPVMLIGGQRWPLGQYLFTDPIRQEWAEYDSGPGELRSVLSSPLADAMAIVDTELEHAFAATGESADDVLRRLVAPLGLEAAIDTSPSQITNAWTAGTSRMGVLGTVAEFGGYLAPWFDHRGILNVVRRFEPALAYPVFDWDAHPVVIRESITRANDIAHAPNRFVVVGNGGGSEAAPVVAYCDAPSTAPHSAVNIGFVRPRVVEAQVSSGSQAQELAETLCLTQAVSETVTVATVLDPRHEAHQVVRFEGELWLEVAWSMDLVAGGLMRHTLQRAYRPSPTPETPLTFT